MAKSGSGPSDPHTVMRVRLPPSAPISPRVATSYTRASLFSPKAPRIKCERIVNTRLRLALIRSRPPGHGHAGSTPAFGTTPIRARRQARKLVASARLAPSAAIARLSAVPATFLAHHPKNSDRTLAVPLADSSAAGSSVKLVGESCFSCKVPSYHTGSSPTGCFLYLPRWPVA